MNKVSILILALAFGSTAPGVSQVANKNDVGALELRLQPQRAQMGVPQTFTFLLVNKSNHEVYVPIPSVNCGDSFDGAIWLRLHFIPMKPSAPGIGHGCSSTRYTWPSILDRTKNWKILRSGESLSLKTDPQKPDYDIKDPGTYEFWAEYIPPYISNADRETLVRAGMNFPQSKLESAHITFVKKP